MEGSSPDSGSLKTSAVCLYDCGVGQFTMKATVVDSANCMLTVPSKAISDVLKSLVTLDVSGSGVIESLTFQSDSPSLDQLDVPPKSTLTSLLMAAQGSRVCFTRDDGGTDISTTGVFMGFQSYQAIDEDNSEPRPRRQRHRAVVMVGDGRIETIALDTIKSTKFEDPAIQRRIERAMTQKSERLSDEQKRISLAATGEGEREILAMFTMECSIWKPTYRVTVEDDSANIHLQAWAIVENVTDSDWEDVDLKLIAGMPISFVHDLYTARFKTRPVVPVSTSVGYTVPLLGGAPPGAPQPMMAAGAPPMAMMKRRGANSSSAADEEFGDATAARGATAEGMEQSNPVAAESGEVGQHYEYNVLQKVTIRKNQGGLVPILMEKVTGTILSVYKKKDNVRHPFLSVHLASGVSAAVLQPGPVAVFEDGLFAGESMLNSTTPPKKEITLPYAVDLQLAISEVVEEKDEGFSRLELQKTQQRNPMAMNRVLLYRRRVRTTEYTVRNTGAKRRTVHILHDYSRDFARGYRMDSVNGGEEVGNADGILRFRLNSDGNTTLTAQVHFSSEKFSTVDIASPELKQVGVWFSERRVTEEVKDFIEKARDIKNKLSNTETKILSLKDKQKKDKEELEMERETLSRLDKTTIGSTMHKALLERLKSAMTRFDHTRELLEIADQEAAQLRNQFEELVTSNKVYT